MTEQGQKVIAEIRKVAAEQPDHVHGGACIYVYAGKPVCLVGHGLWNAGLVGKNFVRHRTANAENIEGLQVRFGFSDTEIDWLTLVQDQQDRRHTWGNAVRYADEHMAKLLGTPVDSTEVAV